MIFLLEKHCPSAITISYHSGNLPLAAKAHRLYCWDKKRVIANANIRNAFEHTTPFTAERSFIPRF